MDRNNDATNSILLSPEWSASNVFALISVSQHLALTTLAMLFIDDLLLLFYLIVYPPECFIVSWLGRLEHSLDYIRITLVYKLHNTEHTVAGGLIRNLKLSSARLGLGCC